MATKLQELNGKVALITGGSKGIGRGCVEILAACFGNYITNTFEERVYSTGDWFTALETDPDPILFANNNEVVITENGWKVALWDIDDPEGAVVEKAYPDRVFYRHCDVTDEEQIKAGIASTIDTFGKLDCLVNNVGDQQPYHTIDGFSTDDFRKSLEVNLVSCFTMCKYGLPHLRKSKGNVVNISSPVVDNGIPEAVTYASSKAGVTTMTKCLAIDEAKHGVRVNALVPGAIYTPLAERLFQGRDDPKAAKEGFTKLSVFGRCGDPREIGKACLYLATDATYCTGSVLRATGGIEIGFGQKDINQMY